MKKHIDWRRIKALLWIFPPGLDFSLIHISFLLFPLCLVDKDTREVVRDFIYHGEEEK